MATYNVYDQASLNTAINSGDNNIDILITDNFAVNSNIVLPGTASVTMTSSGGPFTVSRGSGAASYLFTVPGTSSLAISNLTIDGNTAGTQYSALLHNFGQLTLNDGSCVQNNTSREYAGGVYNEASGTLAMNGDSAIRNNHAVGRNTESSGGGVYNDGGTVMMNDNASVSNNTSTTTGYENSAMAYGGGLSNTNGGTFTMSGSASVTNNSVTGNNNNGLGGGVYNDGSFIMTGGQITGNKANDSGGGVYNNWASTLIMNGSALVSGNTADSMGGGVYNYGMFSVGGSAGIIDNQAEGGGGLCNHWLSTLTMSGGEISGNKATLGGGIFAEAVSDTQITGGMIFRNTASGDGGGIYCIDDYFGYGYTVNISGNAMISNNTAGNDGGGVWIPYKNLSMLDIGSGVVFSNNIARSAHDRSPEDDATYYAHVYATQWTLPFQQGYNNLDISYTRGAQVPVFNPTATKTATGAPLPDGRFQFGLYNQSGSLITTAMNNANGSVFFPTLRLPNMTNRYTIRETSASGNGWTTDSTTVPVIVTVNSGGVTVSYPDGAPVFTNSYAPAPASVGLTASKTAAGAALPDGRFDFGVFDGNGNLIATAAADASGNVTFPAIPVTEAGTTNYTVRELSPDGGGWVTDPRAYPVTVTAADNGQGQLVADVSYPAGAPVFANVYTALPASEGVVVYKELKGWDGAEVPFTFGLYDPDGNLLETAQNIDGVVRFPQLRYTAPGVYHYTVCEQTASGNGWTTDGNCRQATITVTDDGSGQLIASASYPEGQPVFTNSYKAAPASARLNATKSAEGAALRDGQFAFTVLDENGSPVAAAANDANGTVSFPAIEYTAPGTYDYTVQEATPSGNGWTADTRTYPVKVTVTDDGQGQLNASVNYPQGMPAFVNTYDENIPEQLPADVILAAKKTLCGACLTAGMFTFGVFDQNGNEAARATNDANGNIVFPAVTLSKEGSYTYTIRELNPSGNGWTMDSRTYPATVTVTDDGSGQLIASTSYPQGTPGFVNRYCPPAGCRRACCPPRQS